MLGDIDGRLDLDRFDGIIIHYTLIMSSNSYIGTCARNRLAEYSGLKVAFIQDEYRFINNTVDAIAELGIDVLFSVCDAKAISQIYAHPKIAGVRKETTLTGFVPEHLLTRSVADYEARPLDIAYRARDLSGRLAWLGEIAAEKGFIGKRFKQDAARYDLSCDISGEEADRIYGDAWFEFLASARATLGTESGASVCDFTGEIQKRVEDRWFREPDTPFEVLKRDYFAELDGKIIATAISPRSFEAAALRTLMICYPGHYSGILEPWRHYVPLERDHSNMDEVVAVLRDPKRAGEIIYNAYSEIACNPKYHFSELARHFDGVFREEFAARGKVLAAAPRGGVYYEEYLKTHAHRLRIKAAVAGVRQYLLTSRSILPRLFRLVYGGPRLWWRVGVNKTKLGLQVLRRRR